MSLNDLNFKFLVKFYTPDPGLLEEEYTRSELFKLFIFLGVNQFKQITNLNFIIDRLLGSAIRDKFMMINYFRKMLS